MASWIQILLTILSWALSSSVLLAFVFARFDKHNAEKEKQCYVHKQVTEGENDL